MHIRYKAALLFTALALTALNVTAVVQVQIKKVNYKVDELSKLLGVSNDVVNLKANSIQLTGGTNTQGLINWNTDEETLDVVMDGAVLQLGQEAYVNVKNDTGAILEDGSVVYISGTDGASGNVKVKKFLADGSIEADSILGVITHEIPIAAFGKATTFGKVRGYDTSEILENTLLYASEITPGALTTNVPIPSAVNIPVALTLNQKQNGTLLIRLHPPHDENDIIGRIEHALPSVTTNFTFMSDGSTTGMMWFTSGILTNVDLNIGD